MLSWSHSPFTNCSSGEPRPGTGVALYELERSKLYSVGIEQDGDHLVLVRAVEDGDGRLLELCLAHGTSQPSPFALDADARARRGGSRPRPGDLTMALSRARARADARDCVCQVV